MSGPWTCLYCGSTRDIGEDMRHKPECDFYMGRFAVQRMQLAEQKAYAQGKADERASNEHIANAHLIAAAPDLLAACEALLDSEILDVPHNQLSDMLDAVIKKARGEK